jgi:hypothetical protein
MGWDHWLKYEGKWIVVKYLVKEAPVNRTTLMQSLNRIRKWRYYNVTELTVPVANEPHTTKYRMYKLIKIVPSATK